MLMPVRNRKAYAFAATWVTFFKFSPSFTSLLGVLFSGCSPDHPIIGHLIVGSGFWELVIL